ncbi:hypothetical protein LLE49_04030 [Alicyclobacillus tolerans]|uniref:hypothetical protein n=1 Tax=Alicyclobacillus tolerans TaxID=90970 RepID=UPI001F33FE32|nr:hypothetical protein [Alicyclobacillus tolerans]MCF8563906.1 hypothetical protein [Alicyclobacillus tolerans]
MNKLVWYYGEFLEMDVTSVRQGVKRQYFRPERRIRFMALLAFVAGYLIFRGDKDDRRT